MIKFFLTFSIRILFILCVFSHNSVTAELPDLGSSASGDLSIYDERILGSQIYQQIIQSDVLLDDAEATDYLKQKLKQIIKSGTKQNLITGSTLSLINQFDVFLIKDSMINAFALPGAKIGVNLGLFLGVDSEGQLMSVLSHELAHITQRHISRMYGNRKDSSALMMAAALLSAMAISSSNTDAALGLMTFGQGAAIQNKLIFSREAEHEADRVGLKFLISGGFEPLEMIKMLETLNRANFLAGQTPSWFSSHPMNFERIAEIKSRISFENKRVKKPIQDQGEVYRWIRSRLKEVNNYGSVDNLKTKQIPNERLLETNSSEELYGLFWRSLFDKKYKTSSMILTTLERKIQTSANKYELKPMFFLAKATLENRLTNYSNSIKVIKKTSSVNHKHPSKRALLRLLLKNYIEKKQFFLADDVAEVILRQWPKDFWVWSRRAEIAENLGLRTRAHIYSAESYIAMHKWYLAIEQLKIAKTDKELDFITLSKVDSRLKEIEKTFRRSVNFSNR